jgi:Tfp pilus assembly protein PilN
MFKFPSSVDRILAVFTKTIKDLESLEAAKTQEVQANNDKVSRLNFQTYEALKERDRAAAVRAKLQDLTSTKELYV